jgi:broad specificity phosphatase PhoE
MIAYLLRHGQPVFPQDEAGNLLVYGPDAPLSPEGRTHIAEIARAIMQMEGRPIDRLVTSPFRRTWDTARVIAEVMKISPDQVLEDSRLRDTTSTWPGTPLSEFLKAWEARTVFDDPHTLETMDELRDRMTSVVNDHLSKFDGKMIGLITHGDPLRAWLYPLEKAFPSYGELVTATFNSIEGIRIEISPEGIIQKQLIANFITPPLIPSIL